MFYAYCVIDKLIMASSLVHIFCGSNVYILFVYLLSFMAQRLKICRTPGPTACLNMLTFEKDAGRRKSMIAPRQPQTCTYPIYT